MRTAKRLPSTPARRPAWLALPIVYVYRHIYIYIYIYVSVFLYLSLSLSIYIYIYIYVLPVWCATVPPIWRIAVALTMPEMNESYIYIYIYMMPIRKYYCNYINAYSCYSLILIPTPITQTNSTNVTYKPGWRSRRRGSGRHASTHWTYLGIAIGNTSY